AAGTKALWWSEVTESQSLPACLERRRRQGAGSRNLRDRHRVTVVRGAIGGKGAERQAAAHDDSRKNHADGVLGFAAEGGKHDGLLVSLSVVALLRACC